MNSINVNAVKAKAGNAVKAFGVFKNTTVSGKTYLTIAVSKSEKYAISADFLPLILKATEENPFVVPAGEKQFALWCHNYTGLDANGKTFVIVANATVFGEQ